MSALQTTGLFGAAGAAEMFLLARLLFGGWHSWA
jgi:hypothetical protein